MSQGCREWEPIARLSGPFPQNELRKTTGKPTEAEKKMAAERAEEERLVAQAAEKIKAKLAEMMKPAAGEASP